MGSAVQNLLAGALGDVARATKYEVLFSFTDPKSTIPKDDLIIMGKTASFPGKSHTIVDFKYKGRSIPIKGQTKYTQTWECSFYLTEDHRLKKSFENWVEALDENHNYQDVNGSEGTNGIRRIQGQHNSSGYTSSIFLYQKNFDDSASTATYELLNAFPIEVSAIQTGYESRGVLQEFTVTFAYSHFISKIYRGANGNFVDDVINKSDFYSTLSNISSVSGIASKIDKLTNIDNGIQTIKDFNFSSGSIINNNNTQQQASKMGAGVDPSLETIMSRSQR